ncbi:MAG: carbamoyl-phosphate synthase large subunit [Chlamydiales bacterium]|jgi:carbamoyl-phosphate synthase large subunit
MTVYPEPDSKGLLNKFQVKSRVVKPKKVLLLGSGALRIGQAGEFDYSGSQALKAMREEGVSTVLINPNIASIQTDEGLADKTYFLPVEPDFVEKIIEKEEIDAILLSFGGQTALNCGLELEEKGIFSKHGVRVMGTPVSTIRLTEDRHLFSERLAQIGVKTARSKAVYNVADVVKTANEIGFPVMMRSGFSLGGKGSGVVHNEKECRQLAEIVFSSVQQILVEECLTGWKEIEYEVVRDGSDSCVTICNMENLDPMGVHTGESIVVAPSQTLDDFEYQMLRDVAIKTIRSLGIIGECNIQYALDPQSREYRVIEVNARLSRSSALASKATGYPLAYVAAKIALGYDMADIPNAITKVTTAYFEPALDYIVCKIPRWDLDKFDGIDQTIGTEMKSVGEVMSIGRSFAEVIQKGIRMLEIGFDGVDSGAYEGEDLKKAIATPTPKRIFALAKGFQMGMSVDEIFELTKIDRFFLYEIERIVKLETELKDSCLQDMDKGRMRTVKKAGFSDKGIAKFLKSTEGEVRRQRRILGIRPFLSQIDTLAAEYPAETNFLYLTYTNVKSDVQPSAKKKVMILGSGCYRIGASVEFDWCGVSAVKAAEELGYEVIMLNYNPETVSTDYDNCDRLVFDEISLETVLEIYDFEKPDGLIVSMGGQTPNNLALKLHEEDVPIFGTHPTSIDSAEDRNKFSAMLDEIGVDQPLWASSTGLDLTETIDNIGGFPVLVRPSYVLSGAAMRVAYNHDELTHFLNKATDISSDHPVTISKFEHGVREVELDAVAYNGEIKLFAISEHIENAGVHSGDATLVIPPQRLNVETMKRIKQISERIARALNITGPFNIQFLCLKHHVIKVIECNLRASRSFPFISKALGINFIREATKLMLSGKMSEGIRPNNIFDIDYVVTKSPQFSFSRLKGADPRLGVEMASTGEVACFGRDAEESLLASMLASGFKIPQKGVLLSLEIEEDRPRFVQEAKLLLKRELKLYACPHTAEALKVAGVECQAVDISEVLKDDRKELVEFLKSGKVDMIISIPGAARVTTTQEGYWLRRLAVELELSFITDLWLAKRAVLAMDMYSISDIGITSWNKYLQADKQPLFAHSKQLSYLADDKRVKKEGRVLTHK